jgi:glycosyltransferase involved in cell wall biosynthesis
MQASPRIDDDSRRAPTGVQAGEAGAPAPRIYWDGVSIIVCTYNRRALLQGLIESLLPQLPVAYPLEVIIVDNNCSDGTGAYARRLEADHPSFIYLHEPRQGLSHARNAGATAARHGFLLYLDDDAVLPPHYLATLGRRLAENDPDFFGGPLYPLYVDPKPAWFPESLEIRKKTERSGFDDNIVLTGANYGVRKSVLQRVGGFDPEFGMTGGKVGMLEERLVIEAYRRLVAPEDQKIYYGLDNFILNTTPKGRMRVGFQLQRIWIGNAQFMRWCLGQGIRTPRLLLDRVWSAFWGEVWAVLRAAPEIWRRRRDEPERAMLALVKLTYRSADLAGALGFVLTDLGRVRRRLAAAPREDRPLRITLFTLASPGKDGREPPDIAALRAAVAGKAILEVVPIASLSDDRIRLAASARNLRAQDLILTDSPKAARALSVLRGPRPHLQIVLWMHDAKPMNYLKSLQNFWEKRQGVVGRLWRDRALFAEADQVICGASWLAKPFARMLVPMRACVVIPQAPRPAASPKEARAQDAARARIARGWAAVIDRARIWAPRRLSP